jgi:hypothetical protein
LFYFVRKLRPKLTHQIDPRTRRRHFGGGAFTKLEIVMNNPDGCEKYPHDNMDEHCE